VCEVPISLIFIVLILTIAVLLSPSLRCRIGTSPAPFEQSICRLFSQRPSRFKRCYKTTVPACTKRHRGQAWREARSLIRYFAAIICSHRLSAFAWVLFLLSLRVLPVLISSLALLSCCHPLLLLVKNGIYPLSLLP